MDTIAYIIIGACIIGCFVALCKAGLFKKKKKAKKETKKAEPVKKEEPKKEEPKDRSFKVAKKSKLTRVRKKALETNARTATIERVFERTPPKSLETQEILVEQPMEESNRELLEELKSAQTDEKVVSIAELKRKLREQRQQQQEQAIVEEEEQSNIVDAGQTSGEYFGVHIGAGKSKIQRNQASEIVSLIQPSPKPSNPQMPSFEELFNKSMGTRFGPKPAAPKVQEEAEIDYSDAVIAEAILNPKYKQFQNKNKK